MDVFETLEETLTACTSSLGLPSIPHNKITIVLSWLLNFHVGGEQHVNEDREKRMRKIEAEVKLTKQIRAMLPVDSDEAKSIVIQMLQEMYNMDAAEDADIMQG